MNRAAKETAIWSAAGMGLMSLAGTFEAVAHHVKGNFETLSQSFAHVAQPENIALAAAISVVAGAGIAFFRHYNKQLDRDETLRKQVTPPQAAAPKKPQR
ncbi:MAG: hypothetical protein H6867_01030 [Rhodospirillales bacterium]|nr:hypothetical protein [Rhodospirillales bacterium]MCB9997311.1 hypothetical protein [Rhodospirillales bacterium]